MIQATNQTAAKPTPAASRHGRCPASRIDPQAVARVLTEIAETAAETMALQEVFHRVATSVRALIPFEHMGVIRILEGQWAVKHAATIDCPDHDGSNCSQPLA